MTFTQDRELVCRHSQCDLHTTLAAKSAGLDIITWTLERSGLLRDGGGYHYESVTDGIRRDGDTMVMLMCWPARSVFSGSSPTGQRR